MASRLEELKDILIGYMYALDAFNICETDVSEEAVRVLFKEDLERVCNDAVRKQGRYNNKIHIHPGEVQSHRPKDIT